MLFGFTIWRIWSCLRFQLIRSFVILPSKSQGLAECWTWCYFPLLFPQGAERVCSNSHLDVWTSICGHVWLDDEIVLFGYPCSEEYLPPTMIGLGSNFCTSVPPHVYLGRGGVLALGLAIFMMKSRSKGSKVSKSVFGSLWVSVWLAIEKSTSGWYMSMQTE